MNIAIVTDSTADIPEATAHQKKIHVVPNLVIIDGVNYEDGIDLTRQEFYERLPEMVNPPTTATASSGAYQTLFEDLLDKGYQKIVSIHVSKEFSGVLNAASVAAQAIGESVQVIDSRQVTLGLGFQVIAAAEMAIEGGTLEAIIAKVEDIRRRVRVVAMLDTLEYLHRSGRVSWARARIGNLLRVKPFIEVKDGSAFRLGDVRTRSKGVVRLQQLLQKLGDLEQLAILHSNAEVDARRFIDTYPGKLPLSTIIVNVTTTIGTHVGPKGLGFAAVIA